MMRRRTVLRALLGSAMVALAAPLAARAQQTRKVYRVGCVTPSSPSSENQVAFRPGLQRLGYIEERNVTFEYRFGSGSNERLRDFAVETGGPRDRVMNRRAFIVGGVAALAAPFGAEAQPAAKIARVGVLRPGNAPPGDFGHREAFEGGLRDLGWTPGTDILIEYRYADGKPERLSELAAELVRLPVDVIVAGATTGARAAQQATRTIPIVMSTLPDPVGAGLVASLARPGGNTTGLTLDSEEMTGKQLELLKEVVPRLSSVAVLGNPSSHAALPRQTEAAGAALGLKVQDFLVSHARDLAPTFAAMRQARVGAILVLRDPGVIERSLAEVVALAARQRLPALYFFREFPEAGGLMSYGANVKDIHRRSAAFVDKILKGAKPADLPIQQPTKFELVINLKTAKALGLTIPQSLLLRADQVLQ